MRSDAAAQQPMEPLASGLLAELAVHQRNAIHRASQVRLHAAGDVLMSVNAPSRCAVFPITALVAVGRPLRDGRRIASGLVGNEGMLGMDIILDNSGQMDEAVVQCAGTVYCMPADDLRHHFDATGRLQRSILRFAHTFLGQVAQNTACARFHDVKPRLAKWLLMIDERAGKLEAGGATSLLAAALGAEEREIEKAIEQLAAGGAVRQRSGTISIRREVLEPWACECYETVRFDGPGDRTR